MFSFSQEGKTLTLNKVDEIAATFWGKDVHPHNYASPYVRSFCNWFDMIGHPIEDCQYIKHNINKSKDPFSADSVDWGYVVGMLIRNAVCHEKKYTDVVQIVEELKPFIELCYHFEAIGIVAHPHGW